MNPRHLGWMISEKNTPEKDNVRPCQTFVPTLLAGNLVYLNDANAETVRPASCSREDVQKAVDVAHDGDIAVDKPLVVELWPDNVLDEAGNIGAEKIAMSPKLDRKQVEVTESTRMVTNLK